MQHLYRSGLLLITLFLANLLNAQTYETALTGRMEVPPVATLASGAVTAELNGNTLTLSGDFDDLRSDFNTAVGAHLHIGYAGSNGPVAIPLVPVLDTDLRGGQFQATTNTFVLTSEQLTALEERRMYVNIHTVDNPSGAIRGQLRPAAANTLTAGLYGPNEVPPVATMGQGMLLLELDGDQLTVSGSFNDLSSPFATNVGAHLHTGLPGANGPVDIALVPTVGADGKSAVFAAADNAFTVNPNQAAVMLARGYYANVHSEAYPAGEIRGQVVGEPRMLFRSALSGGFGIPMVQTLARGQILGELGANTLSVYGNFVGLTSPFAEEIAGGAHLHTGPAGQTGPVRVPLVASLAADSLAGTFAFANNTYPADSALAMDLLQRQIYLNIHSDAHPAGETRGQMLPEAQTVMTAILHGSQEVDDVLSPGIGQIKAEINSNRITLSGGFQNLGSDLDFSIAGGMHVHLGAAGRGGPIVIPTPNVPDVDLRSSYLNPFTNTYALRETLRDSMLMRMTYFNVHSLDHPAGEIRGQFLLDAANYVFAPLGGASETDPVNTPATGMLVGELFPGRVSMTGSFQELQSDYAFDVAGGAHLHNALAGSNGDIVFLLNSEVADDNRHGLFLLDSNVIELDMDQLALLQERRLYANIHSVDQPAGELRGQVLPISRSVFHSTLQGDNSVPPNATTGIGGVKAEIRDQTLYLSGSFGQLTSDYDSNIGSHLHFGRTGETGPVIFPLVPELDADLRGGSYRAADNTFPLDSTQLAAFRGRDMYVNIHTADFPAGEIRGQVVTNPNLFPNADADIVLPVAGATLVVEGSPDDEVFVDWDRATDPDNDTLAYTWQLGLDEEFDLIGAVIYTGQSTETSLRIGFLDSLLTLLTIPVGGSATFYHRVVTTDGSNTTASPGAAITLERGVVTNTRAIELPRLGMQVYPTVVAAPTVTVTLETERQQAVSLVLTTLEGRSLRRQSIALSAGQNQFPFEVSGLAAGQYYLHLLVDDRLLEAHKIIVP